MEVAKRKPGVSRKVLMKPPNGSINLGCLKFPWKERKPPRQILLTNTIVLVDGAVLNVSQIDPNIFALHSSSVVFFVWNSQSTVSELWLDVCVKSLPLANAAPFASSVFGVRLNFEPMDVNLPWDCLINDLVGIRRVFCVDNLQHSRLKPTLRGYQSQAVAWMLHRESGEVELKTDWLSEIADVLLIPSGEQLLFNKVTNTIFPAFPEATIRTGGILADEMGLGKTVVTLAVILNNPRQNIPDWEGVICQNDSDFESDDDEPLVARKANQEDCLNETEKLELVTSKPGKGVLKRHLTAWYESMLAETSPKRLKRNRGKLRFKCICGDEVGKGKTVRCGNCRVKQHVKCGGFEPAVAAYFCPECWKLQKRVPTKATLIVTPPAIFQQWAKEIERHAEGLSVYLYNGVREKFVQPTFLASFDVVITTFPVLRAETLYAESTERKLRNESRFLRPTCPLECLDWWRVVCDEAQMVESNTSLIREMVNRLETVHRWCVTGTPIQKDPADLYYLTSFLGLGPFDEKRLWKEFLLDPYLNGKKTPLLTVVGEIFWRSTKEQVGGELAIPEQSFTRHLLNFSKTETIFYAQLHEKCAGSFAERLVKFDRDTQLAWLDKATMKKLLEPLLKLRQACTHAQIVAGINISRAGKVSTLPELLDYLCKKTKVDCDDAIREHVGAINGIAGLHWLLGEYEEAVENYRSVLRLADKEKESIHVDTLQLIHTMTNLALLLTEHPGVVAPTLRDEKLTEQLEGLEKKYLEKSKTALMCNLNEATFTHKEVEDMLERAGDISWWVSALMMICDLEGELIFKINEQLYTNDFRDKESVKKFLATIQSVRSVELTVRNWWSELEECYKTVSGEVIQLADVPCGELVEEAINCHLRNTKKNECRLCTVEAQLLDLECLLFATERKEVQTLQKVLDGSETRGSWKPNRAEELANIVFNFAKGYGLGAAIIAERRKFWKLLDGMKKEFKLLRALWTSLNHCVHAQDELAMSKWRLRFAEPWERVKKNTRNPELALALSTPEEAQKVNVIYPEQVYDMMVVLKANGAFAEFQRKRGKLIYLQNLRTRGTAESDPCPVCHVELKDVKSVLPCGHSYCIKCLESLRGGAFRLSCPVCRQTTVTEDILFFETETEETAAATTSRVAGKFSAKIDAIVDAVLSLLTDDATIKILVFSSWTQVLKILAEALTKNAIAYLSLPSAKHQKIIEEFKTGSATVLLLPLAWGSKGLNLVEATHVFLVEPILNPAEELQAIGRVHRIGQTKPTFVHRFILRKTIEEKIFEVVSEANDVWSKNEATLGELMNLFDQN